MFKKLVGLTAAAVLTAAAPAEAGLTPADLVEVADISSLSSSPDGTKVAFKVDKPSIRDNRVNGTWFVIDLARNDTEAWPIADAGEPLRDSAGGPVNEPPIWAANGIAIYFRKVAAGGVSLWVAAADGSGARQLDDGGADVDRLQMSMDGTSLVFQTGVARSQVLAAEAVEIETGILIDSSISPGEGLVRSGILNGRPATLRHEGWAGRQGLLAGKAKHWRRIDLESGLVTAAGDLDPEASIFLAEQGQGVTEVIGHGAHVGMREPPCQRLIHRNKSAVTVAPWQPRDCDDTRISSVQIINRDQYLVTTTSNQDGLAQTLWIWSVTSNRLERLIQSKGLLSGSRKLSANVTSDPCVVATKKLICVAAGVTDPPRLVAVDLTTGAVASLFDANPGIREIAPVASLIRWQGTDGRYYSGQYYPTSTPRAPLFVTYYTCPGYVRGGMGDEWPLAVLAEKGIAALCINRPFGYPLDPVSRYEAGRHAVEGAVLYLAARGDVDQRKVGMGGLSLGSEIVMWIAMKSDLLAAASVSSPSLTPLSYLLRSLQGERFANDLQAYWALGAPDQTPSQWKAISPSYNIDNIQVPLLMQMPEQEYIQALDYYIPMRMAGHPVELYAFPQASHQKYQPRQKLNVYTRNLDWFAFWLLGDADKDPSKREQFGRWEALRSTRIKLTGHDQPIRPSMPRFSPVPSDAKTHDRVR